MLEISKVLIWFLLTEIYFQLSDVLPIIILEIIKVALDFIVRYSEF